MDDETQKAYDESLEKTDAIHKSGFGTHYECCGTTFVDQVGLSDHLREAHGVDVKTQHFTRTMLMHLDGRDYFASSYAWSCASVTFTEHSKNKRSKTDPMRFGY